MTPGRPGQQLPVGKVYAPANQHRPEFVILEDMVAAEACLEIEVDGVLRGSTMRTPGRQETDLDLVLGFCFSEGLIRRRQDVIAYAFQEQDEFFTRCRVELTHGARDSLLLRQAPRREDSLRPLGLAVGSPPCCILMPGPPVPATRFAPETLFTAKANMELRQGLFKATGATHCSALFDQDGDILAFAEDIGRHNALDKAIGMALRQETLRHARGVVMSSRLSYELVRKTAMAGLPMLAGISNASSMAVHLARRWGLTLVGRLRPPRMNIYAHPGRIELPEG
ncbi:formate dehydrogenase accessory sulfurtransferase FdhD [Megalodesulfovibrio paquesii]